MARRFSLFIDPGHGGDNDGTLSLGVPEKEYTLDLAKRLSLSFHGVPYLETALSRYEDENISLAERGAASAEWGADLVVVLHVNAIRKDIIHGLECYVLPHQEAALKCSEAVLNAAPRELRPGRTIIAEDPRPGTPGDWIEHPINTMKYHSPHTNAVLIECGYGTNHSDRMYLNSGFGIDGVVTAIRAGVIAAANFITKL